MLSIFDEPQRRQHILPKALKVFVHSPQVLFQ
jgi:hypothetical protein